MKKSILFFLIFLVLPLFSATREDFSVARPRSEALREFILDTETTGLAALRPVDPDRLTEIACLELINGQRTGRQYQTYLNPERSVPRKITEITGLDRKFLKHHPKFADIADDFLAFIQDSPLVIHNASFDLRFLNAELARLGKGPLLNPIVDTLALARAKFPGARVNLDALCTRFGIDRSRREKHGALIDCELLEEVYAQLKEESRAKVLLEGMAALNIES